MAASIAGGPQNSLTSVDDRFIGFIDSCEFDGHDSQAKQQEKKPNKDGGEAAQLQAAENGENSIRRTTNNSVRHAPDNLIKEKPSAGGAGKGLVVESVIGVTSGIGGDGAEKAFFDRDADRASDRVPCPGGRET